MKVKEYMISVYAVLVKNSKRDIESLPPPGGGGREGGGEEPERKGKNKRGRRGRSSRMLLSPPSCVCRSRASGGRLTQASRLGNASKIGPFFLKYAVPISQKTCRATNTHTPMAEKIKNLNKLFRVMVL